MYFSLRIYFYDIMNNVHPRSKLFGKMLEVIVCILRCFEITHFEPLIGRLVNQVNL